MCVGAWITNTFITSLLLTRQQNKHWLVSDSSNETVQILTDQQYTMITPTAEDLNKIISYIF